MTNAAQAAGMAACWFTFGEGPDWPGFSHGSKWNGFDNVAVTPETREQIAAWLAASGEDDEAISDLMAIAPGADGLVSLGWGYATLVVSTPEGKEKP